MAFRPRTGLAMWTADSDYQTAPCVIDAVRKAADHGVFGYSWMHPDYLASVQWWMKTRHDWEIDTDWILTTQGLGNAIALCRWMSGPKPGDGIVIFTPVYHEFAHKVNKSGRRVVECPLVRDGDSYGLDLDDAQSRSGRVREDAAVVFAAEPVGSGLDSPEELRAVAAFAERNGLILVSDEIHHDLVYPGSQICADGRGGPGCAPWTVTLTAASKTFNIAGQRTGNMIIPIPNCARP